MRGTYALVINIRHQQHVRVGSLGDLCLAPGWWVYVGSAMGHTSMSIERRIGHQFSIAQYPHWHIDYILRTIGEATAAVWAESVIRDECRLSRALADSDQFKPGPRRFGASDCRAGCYTHLYSYIGHGEPIKSITEVLMSIGLCPKLTLKN